MISDMDVSNITRDSNVRTIAFQKIGSGFSTAWKAVAMDRHDNEICKVKGDNLLEALETLSDKL